MKIALYIRVSTRDKQDITKQRDYLLDFMSRQEGWDVYKIYADKGVSGSKQHRPGLDEMLSEIDEWDGVLVYKLDRIGRSMKHLFELVELFEKKEKSFTSATQAIDTSKPEGRLFFNMLSAFAEFEREITVMRIKDGLDLARKRGKKLGRKVGCKDLRPRRKIGYYRRWEKERSKKLTEIPPNSVLKQKLSEVK